MAKRDFRPGEPPDVPAARYPTSEDFEPDRRQFLGRLAALLGAGALGAAVAACGGRPTEELHPHGDGGPLGPDLDPPLAGAPPMPDAGLDAEIPKMDAGWPLAGEPPMPDAAVDADWPIGGGAPPMPDAAVDAEPDWGTMGVAPAPDAAVDADWPIGGGAPAPDAALDKDP